MMMARVKSMLDLLDERVAQDGGKPYPELEKALQAGREGGDAAVVCDAALEMGIRLLAMATLARALAGQPGVGDDLPSPDDVLEPSIELLSQSLEAARTLEATGRIAFVQSRLADAYLQSRQFAKARDIFLQVAGSLTLPRDLWLHFDTTQKLGDCGIEMEEDDSALRWYEIAMDAAREIDDPFEIHVQHAKIASALRNLKRYDEAEDHLHLARELVMRIGTDEDLQRKIVVHRNSFSVEALPRMVDDIDEFIASVREGLGRELLRELPGHIGRRTLAVIHGTAAPAEATWPVLRRLAVALRSAASVLEGMLDMPVGATAPGAEVGSDEAAVLRRVGALTRAHFGINRPDPPSLEAAARELVHVDRSRRAVTIARNSAGTALEAGPDFGAGSKHVVYLRSFVASPQLPAWDVPPWSRIDLEELLACQLDASPFIALGDADFERLGPGRVRTTDENWRDVLHDLALTAQMLLVIPAMTRGTCWEIEWVVTNKLLHKTCVAMPPSGGAARDWWTSNWAELRRWSVQLGIAMPEYSDGGGVFRLGEFGQIDRIAFADLYSNSDLHMTLLRLLMRPFPSYDFLYAIQRRMEEQGGAQAPAEPPASAPADPADALLQRLQESERFEMSNWWRDAPKIPAAPGLLLLYEGPFQLLWVDDCDDLRARLEQYSEGRSSDFTRMFFHLRVIDTLNGTQSSQLLDESIGIEDVMRVRVKQVISYRWCEAPDAALRARAAERAWQGALRIGAPKFKHIKRSDR
jgi:tetratricopeptide (TPR) repeat protein